MSRLNATIRRLLLHVSAVSQSGPTRYLSPPSDVAVICCSEAPDRFRTHSGNRSSFLTTFAHVVRYSGAELKSSLTRDCPSLAAMTMALPPINRAAASVRNDVCMFSLDHDDRRRTIQRTSPGTRRTGSWRYQ
ncbi:Gluconate kinase [Pseudomonas syringae pv. actinidiae]|uniref:Gluconate kinase n=1 Tax=Pseudomonas syringae pv. actinidiae TaxID=103796 RepID=A0A2V0QXK5_PSESF|nr:Gluconate kinase [Pseudomonas syringae pv. actinidiae]